MKHALLLFFLWLPSLLCAQFAIGHKTLYFYDASRSNIFGQAREIEVEAYYPADVAGDDVAIRAGQYPVLVFGHGFVMRWDSYDNFWERFVPQGYIMLFPRTEGNIFPSHSNFGQDLAFLVDEMLVDNSDPSAFFYQSQTEKYAIMGHSMGGGSTFLAAQSSSNIDAIVTYAAAETNPSAEAAAANLSVPALVFAGEEDCVAPPANHAKLIFDNLSSPNRAYLNINNAAHCNFANYNANCQAGQDASCGSANSLYISRYMQQLRAFTYTEYWLDVFLKGDSCRWEAFVSDVERGELEGDFSDTEVYTNGLAFNCCGKDVFEPNNLMSEASPLPRVGTNENARLCGLGDVDWFSFQVSAAKPNILLTLKDVPNEFRLELYDDLGNLLQSSDSAGVRSEEIVANALAPATYFVKVAANSSAESEFAYRLMLQPKATLFSQLAASNSHKSYEKDFSLNKTCDNFTLKVYTRVDMQELLLSYSGSSDEKVKIQVRDMNARLQIEEKCSFSSSKNEHIISTSSLSSGIYLVSIQSLHTTYYMKMNIF